MTNCTDAMLTETPPCHFRRSVTVLTRGRCRYTRFLIVWSDYRGYERRIGYTSQVHEYYAPILGERPNPRVQRTIMRIMIRKYRERVTLRGRVAHFIRHALSHDPCVKPLGEL